MTLSLSNGAANAVVDTVVDRLDGAGAGTIKVYSGAKPASPDSAPTGTLLATIPLANPAFGAAASRSASLNAVASVTASGTGTAGWFRASNNAGTAQFDGTAGASGSGADLVLDNASITAGGTVTVTAGSVSLP